MKLRLGVAKMNKLIHDLGVQAKDYAAMEHANGVGGIAEFNRLYETKFAELIVKECAELVDDYGDEHNWSAGSVIKKHFGVV